MMEKPLAVSVEHARGIERAANAAKIPVLVNYETTWYSSMRPPGSYAKEQKAIGEIRKVVVHSGHRGPKEIGVQPEFLDWLTDPKRAGGGALFDFGCYGANLMTWLMDDQRPVSVTAVTQRIKPESIRTRTTRPRSSSNTRKRKPSSRPRGTGRSPGRIWRSTARPARSAPSRPTPCAPLQGQAEALVKSPAIPAPEDEFLGYFAAVVRGAVQPSGLSSLKNNLIVTEILDAARQSAATGKAVRLG